MPFGNYSLFHKKLAPEILVFITYKITTLFKTLRYE